VLKYYKKKHSQLASGFSLLELVVAIGIFATLASGITYLILVPLSPFSGAGDSREMARFANEARQALFIIKDKSWKEIEDNDSGSNLKVSRNVNGDWVLAAGTEVRGSFTRAITIATVTRDTNSVIVTSGGSNDPSTKKAIVTVSATGRTDYTQEFYLINWEAVRLYQNSWIGSAADHSWAVNDTGFATSTHASTTNSANALTLDGLEHYRTSTPDGFGCSGSCATTFTAVHTLTVDRTSRKESKDFLVIGGYQYDSDVTGGGNSVGHQMVIDGSAVTDLGESTGNWNSQVPNNADAEPGGTAFAAIATTTIGVESVDISVDYKVGSAGDTSTYHDVSILAMELPTSTFADVEAAEEKTGSDTSAITKSSLTFTPDSGDYLVLGYAEVTSEDWSSGPSFRFKINGTATSTVAELSASAIPQRSATNRYFHMVVFEVVTFAASEQTILWEMQGAGSDDEAMMQNNRIFVIPLKGMNYYYTADSSKTLINSSTYTDVLSLTATVNNAPHLILGLTSIANEHQWISSTAQLDVDGVTVDSGWYYQYKEADGSQMTLFQSYVTNLAAGSKTFKIQGKATDDLDYHEASYKESRILVLEIPNGPTYVPMGELLSTSLDTDSFSTIKNLRPLRIEWNQTIPTDCSLTVYLRGTNTGPTPDYSTSSWAWNYADASATRVTQDLTSDADLAGKRFYQYRVDMVSCNSYTESPTLSDLYIDFD
jgi:prepilin-type N-terminal cleavage/methylation domain-containing protein